MLFNSIEFTLFLPIIFTLYWLAKKDLKIQNLLIVASSYFFYGCWDWRFLFLIIFSTTVDYIIGFYLSKDKTLINRKFLLWISIIVNLGLLGFFKYYNFFLDSFINTFSFFGVAIGPNSLNIILPVGISFYTFQTLSYTIDVYKRRLSPTKDFIAFAAFVSFFPQLVAGPIERATNLLPQFTKKRHFEYTKAIDGLRQILWGLFKKIVIADNAATYVNLVFNNSDDHSGSTLALGAIMFSFQIYGDFSGYSDIAIGVSRLLGFDLMKNFSFPYFSRDVAEFWRRWHISLSTWFRDYLYVPLGGSRVSLGSKIRNTFIVFIVSGFWHGANWTFVVWGFLNALYILPLLIFNRNRNNLKIVAEGNIIPSIKDVFNILTTFCLIASSWVFFRADNVTHAFKFFKGIFSRSFFTKPELIHQNTAICLIAFLIIEWLGREHEFALEKLSIKWKKPIRLLFYYIIIWAIFKFGGEEQQFIYFQF